MWYVVVAVVVCCVVANVAAVENVEGIFVVVVLEITQRHLRVRTHKQMLMLLLIMLLRMLL